METLTELRQLRRCGRAGVRARAVIKRRHGDDVEFTRVERGRATDKSDFKRLRLGWRITR